ncbi:MAG: hypothetical protein U0133_06115 [Gemmatimonadales bacterium]
MRWWRKKGLVLRRREAPRWWTRSRGIFDELDAPVLRVTGADVPMPYNKHLEKRPRCRRRRWWPR